MRVNCCLFTAYHNNHCCSYLATLYIVVAERVYAVNL